MPSVTTCCRIRQGRPRHALALGCGNSRAPSTASSTLRPPGCRMTPSRSSNARPWRARKLSKAGRTSCRAHLGMSGLRTTPKPSFSIDQPIMSSVWRHMCSPVATTRANGCEESRPDPRRNNTPAAPSPNNAVEMKFWIVRSLVRQLIVHSSTTRSRTLPSGSECANRADRARPDTPPAQPRPKTGNRSTAADRPRRLASMASRLGTARPVVETVTMASTSLRAMPARSTHCRATSSRSLTAAVRKTAAREDQPCALKCHSIGTHEKRVFTPVF